MQNATCLSFRGFPTHLAHRLSQPNGAEAKILDRFQGYSNVILTHPDIIIHIYVKGYQKFYVVWISGN